jgi:hypothetical protein
MKFLLLEFRSPLLKVCSKFPNYKNFRKLLHMHGVSNQNPEIDKTTISVRAMRAILMGGLVKCHFL